MKHEITELQKLMKEHGMHAYYVPSGDPHGSEFVHPHYRCCEYLSGFTGENATLIVMPVSAFLWTDGRFFLQAEQQLADTGITLMKIGEPDVPTPLDFLEAAAEAFSRLSDPAKSVGSGESAGGPFVLGFDGNMVSGAVAMEFEDVMDDCGAEVISEYDLVSEIWDAAACDTSSSVCSARPAIVPNPIRQFPIESAGETAASKITRVRKEMLSRGADFLLVSDLMEIAWLFNLRGSDIKYTPVFYSYALVGTDGVRLYVMDGAAEGILNGADGTGDADLADLGIDNLMVCSYDDITRDVSLIPAGKTIWYDPESTSYNLCYAAGDGVGLVEETSPIQEMKASKNSTELTSTINAHIRDGAAVVKFIAWLKSLAARCPNTAEIVDSGDFAEAGGISCLTEYSAAQKLNSLRFRQGAADLSFETIVAYGPNAAIVHYTPQEDSSSALRAEGFLLVDSGGQYPDGTTDITRTISLGPLTQEMRDNYTYVLKAHIAMARAVIHPGQTGRLLDHIGREPLHQVGLDFNHGLSHGVGHVLGVHEPPNVMSKIHEPRPLIPGMIMSDEPGLYFAGHYGIRIENEVYCRLHDGCITLDTITLCPYERKAINTELLTDGEIAWINTYHGRVLQTLSEEIKKTPDETTPYVLQYLSEACAPIAL